MEDSRVLLALKGNGSEKEKKKEWRNKSEEFFSFGVPVRVLNLNEVLAFSTVKILLFPVPFL